VLGLAQLPDHSRRLLAQTLGQRLDRSGLAMSQSSGVAARSIRYLIRANCSVWQIWTATLAQTIYSQVQVWGARIGAVEQAPGGEVDLNFPLHFLGQDGAAAGQPVLQGIAPSLGLAGVGSGPSAQCAMALIGRYAGLAATQGRCPLGPLGPPLPCSLWLCVRKNQ
jgi:hypothetical protein